MSDKVVARLPKTKTVRQVGIYRVSLVKERAIDYLGTVIRSPADVYELVKGQFVDADRERFGVILLTSKNAPVALNEVSVGDLTSAIVHPREVFKPAVIAGAAAVILYHNHPSGDPSPSREDFEVTKRVTEAGKILGIEVLDHVVVGDGKFISLREHGAKRAAA